jgi:hypothetical protein
MIPSRTQAPFAGAYTIAPGFNFRKFMVANAETMERRASAMHPKKQVAYNPTESSFLTTQFRSLATNLMPRAAS